MQNSGITLSIFWTELSKGERRKRAIQTGYTTGYTASIRNINNLELVQRRATRFILGRDYSEYERLSKLNLLPLKYRREINDLVFFF